MCDWRLKPPLEYFFQKHTCVLMLCKYFIAIEAGKPVKLLEADHLPSGKVLSLDAVLVRMCICGTTIFILTRSYSKSTKHILKLQVFSLTNLLLHICLYN